jgi:hypothetical protein
MSDMVVIAAPSGCRWGPGGGRAVGHCARTDRRAG